MADPSTWPPPRYHEEAATGQPRPRSGLRQIGAPSARLPQSHRLPWFFLNVSDSSNLPHQFPWTCDLDCLGFAWNSSSKMRHFNGLAALYAAEITPEPRRRPETVGRSELAVCGRAPLSLGAKSERSCHFRARIQ